MPTRTPTPAPHREAPPPEVLDAPRAGAPGGPRPAAGGPRGPQERSGAGVLETDRPILQPRGAAALRLEVAGGDHGLGGVGDGTIEGRRRERAVRSDRGVGLDAASQRIDGGDHRVEDGLVPHLALTPVRDGACRRADESLGLDSSDVLAPYPHFGPSEEAASNQRRHRRRVGVRECLRAGARHVGGGGFGLGRHVLESLDDRAGTRGNRDAEVAVTEDLVEVTQFVRGFDEQRHRILNALDEFG